MMNRLIEFENEKRIDELIKEIVDLKLKKESPDNKKKIQKLQQELDSLEKI